MKNASQRQLSDLVPVERIVIEDLLRALLECENRGLEATETQLVGLSGVGRQATAKQLAVGLELGLLEALASGVWGLTEGGRVQAIRVMRAHRLTETKLARETGLAAERWHDVAHAKEHRMTQGEVDDLADRLGNPRFDPHGDPIPTREGHFPAPKDLPLLDWAPGEPGVIAHIEDEPAELFARLAAMGLSAGLRFVSQRESGGVGLFVEGRSLVIPHELIALLRVRPLHREEVGPVAGAIRLSDLKHKELGEVVTLLSSCVGTERSRLLDLGFVPGSRIERVLDSPLHGPVAYRVRGTMIALRRAQSDHVLVSRMENGGSN